MTNDSNVNRVEMASDVAKLRRDIKNCYEQHARATACGDVPLVCIDVLGRAVRVFGDWYTICAFCGALARVLPTSRFRSEPCCMRCDVTMVYGKPTHDQMVATVPRPEAPKCRFCGKPEPPNAATKWRSVLSPLDSGGRNESVPPPLRKCSYCPTHFRPWLVAAHQTLGTKVILSHISSRAKPVFGAGEGRKSSDALEDVVVAKRPRAVKSAHSSLAKKMRKMKKASVG